MRLVNKRERAQGSLEYLLILAAILAIAAVVVIVAQAMLSPAERTANVGKTKYELLTKHDIELSGYNEPFDSTSRPSTLETAPEMIIKSGKEYPQYGSGECWRGDASEISGTLCFLHPADYECGANCKELTKLGPDSIRSASEKMGQLSVYDDGRDKHIILVGDVSKQPSVAPPPSPPIGG